MLKKLNQTGTSIIDLFLILKTSFHFKMFGLYVQTCLQIKKYVLDNFNNNVGPFVYHCLPTSTYIHRFRTLTFSKNRITL